MGCFPLRRLSLDIAQQRRHVLGPETAKCPGSGRGLKLGFFPLPRGSRGVSACSESVSKSILVPGSEWP